MGEPAAALAAAGTVGLALTVAVVLDEPDLVTVAAGRADQLFAAAAAADCHLRRALQNASISLTLIRTVRPTGFS